MDPNKDIEELQAASYASESDDSASVDDFIKQLEAKEKDLHITADTSIIEIAESFEDVDLPAELRDALEAAAKASPEPLSPLPVQTDGNVTKLESEISGLKATIAKMEADREEMFQNSQRRAKDFENFKSRAERERKDTYQNQIANVAMLMLPALDNLHRALDSAEHLPGEKNEPFKQFFEGIGLVNEQITDILNKMGIKPIRTIGEEFDPHYHEAVSTEETDEFPPNTVCGEVLRGYIAGDRVIRHSLVKVAKATGNQQTRPECPTDGEAGIELDGDPNGPLPLAE